MAAFANRLRMSHRGPRRTDTPLVQRVEVITRTERRRPKALERRGEAHPGRRSFLARRGRVARGATARCGRELPVLLAEAVRPGADRRPAGAAAPNPRHGRAAATAATGISGPARRTAWPDHAAIVISILWALAIYNFFVTWGSRSLPPPSFAADFIIPVVITWIVPSLGTWAIFKAFHLGLGALRNRAQ